jgi:hypothetical protein
MCHSAQQLVGRFLWGFIRSRAVALTHGKGNIGGEPKIHIFGVIGQEDRIDLVQEGVNTLHIEPLRLADGPDIPRKCSTTLVK